jgi:hypothetical protein
MNQRKARHHSASCAQRWQTWKPPTSLIAGAFLHSSHHTGRAKSFRRNASSAFMAITVAILWLSAIALFAADPIIASSNRIEWVKGVTVGSQYDFGSSLLTTVSNVVTHGADNTGATDCTSVIQTVFNNSSGRIYFPNGVYRVTSGLTFNVNGARIIGESTNAVIHLAGGSITVGVDALAISQAALIYSPGIPKGVTNISVFRATNDFGDTVSAGDSFYLGDLIQGRSDWPIIFASDYTNSGYDSFVEHVVVHSVSGTNLTLKSPTRFDWTNAPRLRSTSYFGSSSLRMKTNVVMANLTITNSAASLSYMVKMSMLRDSIITNCNIWHTRNYNLFVADCAYTTVSFCDIGWSLDDAFLSNHGALLDSLNSGLLVEHTIFQPQFPQHEWNPGLGNAYFGNFFVTNKFLLGPDAHNSHPMMHLFEANIGLGSAWKADGYFGSVSHHTIWRNAFWFLDLKRWTTHLNIVGNIIGDPYNTTYTYEQLLSTGYPNIGNNGYIGTAPPAAWNYPGPSLYGGETNIGWLVTNTVTDTNILWGNYANMVVGKPVVFQDNVNTQILHWPRVTVSAVTSSNITFSTNLNATEGWRMFMGGTEAFQSRQLSDISNCVVHMNRFLTNAGGVIVTNANIAEHTVSNSLLYPSGAPSEWVAAGLQWPGVNYETGTFTNLAAAKYYGALGGDTPQTGGRARENGLRGFRWGAR